MKKLRHLAAALAMVVSLGIMVCGCSSGGTGGEPSAPSQTVTISKDKELSVHFIDVGQADCILIQTPDKKNILIDAGNRDDSSLIQKYLKNQQVDTLDLMVLTHPHEDHIGSAANIIKTYSPAQICMPDAMSTSQVFEKTLNAIVESKCELLPPLNCSPDTGMCG
ncbi:MAG: MBL fold metallo-hydrolase [Oscillospiraceae bacterium]